MPPENSNADQRISIIIPVHNRHDLFDKTINSVINQSINPKQVEIIIVDEASNPPIKIPKHNKQKIILIRNKKALGPSLARTIGLNAATGNRIVFLDSDDTWTREFLSKISEQVDQQKCEIVTTLGKPIFSVDFPLGQKLYFIFLSYIRQLIIYLYYFLNHQELPPSLLYMLRLSNTMFSRLAMSNAKFVMSYRTAEDWKFIWDCINKNSSKIKIYPINMTKFRYHPQSETSRRKHYWGYYYQLVDEFPPSMKNSLPIKIFKKYIDFSVRKTNSFRFLHYYPSKS